MIVTLGLVFSLILSSQVQASLSGDDLVKAWRGKQEAYYKGEELVEGNSKEAVAKLRGLLKSYKFSETKKIKMLHRLADLELNLGRISENKSENSSQSKHSENAIKLYANIINKYPDYDKIDHVIFSFGFEQYVRNNYKRAFKALDVLVRKHKNSKYLVDSYLIQADSMFELKNYNQAKNLYNKVIKSNRDELVAYSKYRKSWALYNNKSYNEAYDNLKALILDDSKNQVQLMATKKEALTDLPLFYYKQSKTFSPYSDILALQNKKSAESTLAQISSLYYSAGQWAKATQTYSELLRNFPTSENLGLYHLKKGLALSTSKNVSRSSVEIASGLKKCQITECVAFANNEIFNLVNDWEKHWRKNQKDSSYANALKTVYPELAGLAKSKKEEAKIYILLAELHHYSKDYLKASIEFERSYLTHPESSYSKQAYWGSIESLMSLESAKQLKIDTRRLKALTTGFIAKFPSDKKSIDAQEFLAQIYVKNNNLTLAADLYKEISFAHLYTESGDSAYNNLVALYAQHKNYSEVVNFLLAIKSIDKKKLRHKTANEDLDKAFEEWSQSLIADKKTEKAAAVLGLALKHRPGSKMTHLWLWNKALALHKSENYRSSADTFSEYLKKHSNIYGREREGLENLLVSYMKLKNYSQALGVCDSLLKIDPKNQDKWLTKKFEIYYDKRQYFKAFESLSLIRKDIDTKNKHFLSLIKQLDQSDINKIMRANLIGFRPDTVGELYLKSIHEMNDIKSKNTKEIAIRLIEVKAQNSNYNAKGHFYLALHESHKFINDDNLEVRTNPEKSLDNIVRRLLPIDDHYRKTIELSTDETQVKALVSMGQIYTEAALKYHSYIKKLVDEDYDISSVRDLIMPFIDQSNSFIKEAQATAKTLSYKKSQRSVAKALRKNKNFKDFLIKNSKPVIISKR